jgi:hypothetical protein
MVFLEVLKVILMGVDIALKKSTQKV